MIRIINYIIRKIKFLFDTDLIELIVSIKNFIIPIYGHIEKSVVIVEPNEFHGEILPGYVHYFNELGYNVTLIIKRRNAIQGIFSRFSNEEMPKIVCLNNFFMRLKLKKISNLYDYSLITSSTLVQKYGFYGFIYDYLGYHPKGNKGIVYVEHSFPNIIAEIEARKIDYKQIIQLSENKTKEYRIPMVNPNYFGKINLANKNSKTTFITVGSINNRNRNFDLLYNSVNKLKKLGYSNFIIKVIGRGTEYLNSDYDEINIIGAVSYSELYQEIEKSDFFLPLLDPNFEGHKRYLKGETTGSRQLILGFQIPPLINEKFADAYSFTNLNSIVYCECDLFNAMLDAIKMDNKTYIELQRDLKSLAETIRETSLLNLIDLLSI